ncbi:hypothetical protein H0H93_002076, partial [Arthromyces matolae]
FLATVDPASTPKPMPEQDTEEDTPKVGKKCPPLRKFVPRPINVMEEFKTWSLFRTTHCDENGEEVVPDSEDEYEQSISLPRAPDNIHPIVKQYIQHLHAELEIERDGRKKAESRALSLEIETAAMAREG